MNISTHHNSQSPTRLSSVFPSNDIPGKAKELKYSSFVVHPDPHDVILSTPTAGATVSSTPSSSSSKHLHLKIQASAANVRFRALLDLHKGPYAATSSRTEKRRICDHIIQAVRCGVGCTGDPIPIARAPPGRFLARNPDKKNPWRVVHDDAEVRLKIGKLLRRAHMGEVQGALLCNDGGLPILRGASRRGSKNKSPTVPDEQSRASSKPDGTVSSGQVLPLSDEDNKSFAKLLLLQQQLLAESIMRAWEEEQEEESDLEEEDEAEAGVPSSIQFHSLMMSRSQK